MNGEPAHAAANANQAANADADSSSTSGLWVFGYGSLCWHPGFDFRRSATGFVRGYARKFWQGNTTHRGTETQPGRVATLVEERDGVVWGRAFEVSGEAALPYLANRECKLGGYVTKFATFFPKRPCLDAAGVPLAGGVPAQPFPALLYVATPSNHLWLGDAPLSLMARQIVECRGATGHNAEYLLRLAEYMRAAAPEADDDHLYALEQLVRGEIRQRRLCLDTLMGRKALALAAAPALDQAAAVPDQTAAAATSLDEDDDEAAADLLDQLEQADVKGGADMADLAAHLHNQHIEPQQQPQQQPQPAAAAAAPQQESLAFSSRVPGKKLRCINIS